MARSSWLLFLFLPFVGFLFILLLFKQLFNFFVLFCFGCTVCDDSAAGGWLLLVEGDNDDGRWYFLSCFLQGRCFCIYLIVLCCFCNTCCGSNGGGFVPWSFSGHGRTGDFSQNQSFTGGSIRRSVVRVFKLGLGQNKLKRVPGNHIVPTL